MAPLLATLAANGLGVIVDAITAKGKAFIEDKLGVSLSKSVQSEEGLVRLRELAIAHEEMLLKYALEKDKLSLEIERLPYEDVKSAREMTIAVQSSEHASVLAKDSPYWLDIFIVVSTFALAYTILFVPIPEKNEQLVYTMFGSLLTLCFTVVQFHRGSSARSQNKDATIEALSKGGTKNEPRP